MKISLIAAMADNRVIGIDNSLPWNLPADMKWFRQNTLGKPIMMGRKTFDSIGKALPGRRNIVVTRDESFVAKGCDVVHDIESGLALLSDVDELMVIGGASFYEQTLLKADRLYLTLVHTEIEGDAWFPEVDFSQWTEISREEHEADEKNEFNYSFIIFDRI